MGGFDLVHRLKLWRDRLPSLGWGLPVIFISLYALTYLVSFSLFQCCPLASALPPTGGGWARLIAASPAKHLALGAATLALALLAYRMVQAAAVQASGFSVRAVWAGWLGAALTLLFTYPIHSTDLFDYAFRAHMLVHLSRNPLTVPPAQVIALEDYPYLAWYRIVDYYGPIWQWLAAALHGAVGESLLANILVFKLLGLVCMVLVALLIQDVLRHTAPEHRPVGLALWLWNPLVLNEAIMNAHNEIVMVTLVMGGLWLVVKRRVTLGLIVLVTAGLVKVTVWIVLPVVLVYLGRQYGWRTGLALSMPGLSLSAVLVWMTYAPFGGLGLLLDLVRDRGWWPTMTWTAAVFYHLRDHYGWQGERLIRTVTWPSTLLFILVGTSITLRTRSLLTATWAVVLAYLLIASHWFQPWYGIFLVALAAVAVQPPLSHYTIVFTGFMLLSPLVAPLVAGLPSLPSGAADALMATFILLIPQLMALRLGVASLSRPTAVRL